VSKGVGCIKNMVTGLACGICRGCGSEGLFVLQKLLHLSINKDRNE